MTRRFMLAVAIVVLGGMLAAQGRAEDRTAIAPPTPDPLAAKPPLIQIAVLLDTSNSMDGLIEQAKSQLWRIVNEFASAKQGGVRPELQVALYHYGTPSLGADTGYIKQLTPFTTDLDKVSELLFGLKTNGGDEYCGWVIRSAVDQLSWSNRRGDYKAIFIAGNEPFTQGSVDYHQSCKAAIAKGIMVNTIFCGDQAEGINTNWKDGADLADGAFMTIDQNVKIVTVTAPQDKELSELNSKLNTTYVPYGGEGAAGAARQAAQDANASGISSSSMAERATAKSAAVYRNERWDLVDASKQGQVKLEELKKEDLPEPMQKMTVDERKAYVAAKAQERADMQAKIAKLSKDRDAYVAEAQRKQAADPGNTLDNAIINAVRGQAQKANFEFAQTQPAGK